MIHLLEARDLRVKPARAPHVLAVVEELVVKNGEVLAIVGESGAGKSSLVRALVAMERLETGRVLFKGETIAAAAPGATLKGRALQRKRRHFQLVFQDAAAALDPRMTIQEAIAEGPLFHRTWSNSEAGDRVRNLMTSFGLGEELAPRFPSELSGGQRRRAALARVFSLEPELLILDEISAGLDADRAEKILDLVLKSAEKRQSALIFVTHDIALIEGRVDRVLVMRQGQIVEQGSAAELFQNPRDAYTQELLAAARGDSAWIAGREPRTE